MESNLPLTVERPEGSNREELNNENNIENWTVFRNTSRPNLFGRPDRTTK
jgi:hypothetical protein